jgi:hypothetical protein
LGDTPKSPGRRNPAPLFQGLRGVLGGVESGVAIFKKDKNVSETIAELRASYGD